MASCTGGDSFRISGFQPGAFDGCFSASAASTFNFLPIFYNTADGMPADGPTVYASDLFGTLSDEYVFAIGWYDQGRDVVERRCFDAALTSAATTHPSEVDAWDCGDLTSTFTVTCGCSTPAPSAAATPAPLIAETPLPSPAPSLAVVTPSPSIFAVTSVPTAAATTTPRVVADTPSPTAAGTTQKPTPAAPVPTDAPAAANTTTTAAPLDVTPSPSAASREINAPSPSPTSASSAVTVCAGTDSFRLGGFRADSYNGCYSASAVSTFNFLPVFYIGGAPVDGATVYASDLSGSLVDEYVWSIGNYNQSGDFVDTRHCVDADGSDASTIHPSEVTTWACEEDSSIVDSSAAFSVTCGCSTPAPVTTSPASTPSPGDARGIDIASSAPVAAAAEEVLPGDAEGVPLIVAIITGVTVFVVVMIALSIVFESLRKGIWMCLTCKRESTSEDTALSTSGHASKLSSRGEHELPVAASGSNAAL